MTSACAITDTPSAPKSASWQGSVANGEQRRLPHHRRRGLPPSLLRRYSIGCVSRLMHQSIPGPRNQALHAAIAAAHTPSSGSCIACTLGRFGSPFLFGWDLGAGQCVGRAGTHDPVRILKRLDKCGSSARESAKFNGEIAPRSTWRME